MGKIDMRRTENSETLADQKTIVKEIRGPSLSRMEIQTLGARIKDLTLSGVKILTTVPRGDGEEGSSHPCSPLFGPEINTHYNLPQHGTMRDSQCKVKENAKYLNTLALECNVKGGSYPGVTVCQNFDLGSGLFTLETFHSVSAYNLSSRLIGVPVNFAEHLYWNAPKGHKGVKINGVDVTKMIEQDEIIEWLPRNKIEIPGIPTIILEQQGLNFAQFWVGKNSAGEYDTNYVCIEPVEGDPKTGFFGSEKSLIKSAGMRQTTIRINLEKS